MKRRKFLGGWKLLLAGSVFEPIRSSSFDRETLLALRKVAKTNAVYVRKGSLYDNIFTEPVESAVFLFQDGRIYVFTVYDETKVEGSISVIVEWFEKAEKQKMCDLLLVVHNHLTLDRFSAADIETSIYLQQSGFEGRFLIYYPWNKKTVRLR